MSPQQGSEWKATDFTHFLIIIITLFFFFKKPQSQFGSRSPTGPCTVSHPPTPQYMRGLQNARRGSCNIKSQTFKSSSKSCICVASRGHMCISFHNEWPQQLLKHLSSVLQGLLHSHSIFAILNSPHPPTPPPSLAGHKAEPPRNNHQVKKQRSSLPHRAGKKKIKITVVPYPNTPLPLHPKYRVPAPKC